MHIRICENCGDEYLIAAFSSLAVIIVVAVVVNLVVADPSIRPLVALISPMISVIVFSRSDSLTGPRAA